MPHAESRRDTTYVPAWKSYFVRIPIALIASPNYLTLTSQAQVLLLDFLRHRDRFTDFGRAPAPEAGIPYSFGNCALVTHRNTYARNMLLLETRNFLFTHGQRSLDGESTFYFYSHQWQQWQPTATDAKKLQKLKTRISRREHIDNHATCTLKVHPPAPRIDNCLLQFWAPWGGEVHSKSAAPSTLLRKETEECAQARAKQEEIQNTQFHWTKPEAAELDNITDLAQAARDRVRKHTVKAPLPAPQIPQPENPE